MDFADLTPSELQRRERRLKSANGVASWRGFVPFRAAIYGFSMLFIRPVLLRADRIPHFHTARQNIRWYPSKYRRTDPKSRPNGAAFIYAPNHGSVYDIPFVGVLHRPMMWVAKPWFCTNWLLAMIFQRNGAVPVWRPKVDGDPERKGNTPEKMRKNLRITLQPDEMKALALNVLERGVPVVVYPEGKREGKSRIDASQSGAAWLAIHSGAPIVPVGIVGVAKGDPTVRVGLLRRRLIVGLVCEPIWPRDYQHITDERERAQAIMQDWQKAVNAARDEIAREGLQSYTQTRSY